MSSNEHEAKLKAVLAAVENCKNVSINDNQFAIQQQIEPLTLLMAIFPSTIVRPAKRDSSQRFSPFSTTLIVNDRQYTGTGWSFSDLFFSIF